MSLRPFSVLALSPALTTRLSGVAAFAAGAHASAASVAMAIVEARMRLV